MYSPKPPLQVLLAKSHTIIVGALAPGERPLVRRVPVARRGRPYLWPWPRRTTEPRPRVRSASFTPLLLTRLQHGQSQYVGVCAHVARGKCVYARACRPGGGGGGGVFSGARDTTWKLSAHPAHLDPHTTWTLTVQSAACPTQSRARGLACRPRPATWSRSQARETCRGSFAHHSA